MKHSTTLSELGMGLDLHPAGTLTKEEKHTDVGETLTAVHDTGVSAGDTTIPGDDRLDHFVVKDGLRFAGTHLIIDLWDASRLDVFVHSDATLRRSLYVASTDTID